MDNSPLVLPLGRSPEFIEASLHFWMRAILGGGTLVGLGLAGGITHTAHRWGSDDPFGIGLVAAGVLLLIVYGVWRFIRAYIRDFWRGVFEAVLNDHSVVFHWRNGSESVVEYEHIDGVFTVYANEHKNYDTLALLLFGDEYGIYYKITDLNSDGEKVEALAEAIRVGIRTAHGICYGDREIDRSLRRKHRDTLPFGRMGLILIWLVSFGMLFVAIMMEREVWMENEVLSSGIVATGLTTAIHPDKGYSLVKYEFRDATEMRYTGQGRLQRDNAEPLLLHGPVDVVYLPNSPDRNLPAGHFNEIGPVGRVLFWIMIAFMFSVMVLASGGLDIAIIRGRVALLRRHELEEEWWERVVGAS